MPKAIRAVLIYPHQLYQELFRLPKDTLFVLIEEPLFFGDASYPLAFHQQKLVMHRASMQVFAKEAKKRGFPVMSVEYGAKPDPEAAWRQMKAKGIEQVLAYDPTDFVLEKRIRRFAAKYGIALTWESSPNFLVSMEEAKEMLGKGKKRLLMAAFYKRMRMKLGILVDDGEPAGGKWSFDVENREALPPGKRIPAETAFRHGEELREAMRYVNQKWAKNPGSLEEFHHPVTRAQAVKLLEKFVEKRLPEFGRYEDAIRGEGRLLFHSGLSSALNIGLLSPGEVVAAAMKRRNRVPLASLEGFIRQVIGWREFMRATYMTRGVEMRKGNLLKQTNVLSKAFYDACERLPPVARTLEKVEATAYTHHIERLMVLGNIFLLCDVKPDEVYRFFMERFIDAYDWVMVPNVYAMSQFACGALITTKPYFSSSNYLVRMSDYPKGEWCEIWDGLYYRFLARHRSIIAKNPRLGVLLRGLDGMSPDRRKALMKKADAFLSAARNRE